MKKDLLTGKSGKIGLIIKALLLFAAVFAAAVMLFALIMYIFAAGFKYSALFRRLRALLRRRFIFREKTAAAAGLRARRSAELFFVF